MTPDDLDNARKLFDLTEPFTREALEQKRRELLATWNPQRYANLTNNPKKYMKSYKQGEEWKQSDRFGQDDLLVLAKLLDMADSWIWTQQQQAKQQAA